MSGRVGDSTVQENLVQPGTTGGLTTYSLYKITFTYCLLIIILQSILVRCKIKCPTASVNNAHTV